MNYFNKDLDNIGFKLIEPCLELKPFIQSFWLVKFKRIPFSVPLKIIADGNSGFVINFSSAYIVKMKGKSSTYSDKFVYFPPSEDPAFVSAKGNVFVIGVRFNAAGVYRFFNKDISSFNNNISRIENSSDWQIDSLFSSLEKTQKVKDKIHTLELFLLDKLKHSKKRNSPWIFEFISRIREEKGNVNIQDLCEEFNVDIRHVQRRFKIELGLSAKLYSRLIRIQDSKKTLSSLIVASLTSFSYDKGFFDQSHFINEFKHFIKETPREYLHKKFLQAKEFSFKKYKK